MRNASKEKEYNKAYMAGGILGFKKNLCCLIFVFLRKHILSKSYYSLSYHLGIWNVNIFIKKWIGTIAHYSGELGAF